MKEKKNINIEEIAKEIEKENKEEKEKSDADVEKRQRERFERLNKKLIFAKIYIKRDLTEEGKHEREISIDNRLYQKHYVNIEAKNSCFLIDGEDYVRGVFDTIEEAEEFVERTIEKVKRRLEEIKKEYEKEKRLKEEEVLFIY